MLWRSGDWPEAVDRYGWKDGFALLSAQDLRNVRYRGPVAMSPNVAQSFQVGLSFGSP